VDLADPISKLSGAWLDEKGKEHAMAPNENRDFH